MDDQLTEPNTTCMRAHDYAVSDGPVAPSAQQEARCNASHQLFGHQQNGQDFVDACDSTLQKGGLGKVLGQCASTHAVDLADIDSLCLEKLLEGHSSGLWREPGVSLDD